MKLYNMNKLYIFKGMICAIKGAIFLFEQLKKEGFQYLMTTKVNKWHCTMGNLEEPGRHTF